MASQLIDSGISVLGEMPFGTHFCSFYETKQDLLDILIPFFKSGLESNQFCLWIVANSERLTIQEAENALRAVLPDLDKYIAEKSIEFVGHEWFLKGGSFDSQRVAYQFKKKLDEVLARGYAGMRATSSPAWLETGNVETLREYEVQLDQSYSDERIILSCTYPIGSGSADLLLDIAGRHQFVIARRRSDWDVVETPELTQAKAEIERLNAQLEERVVERTEKPGATTARLRAEIEQRKSVEERLREYEKAVEGLDEMIVVVDRDYRYVVANRAFLNYRGLEAEQVVGRQISDVLNRGVFENIVKAKLDECFAGRIIKYETRYNYPTLGDRDLSISYFPIEGRRGVDRAACILQDITEAKRAEEALRASESKFRRLLDSTIIGVVFWDINGHLFSANDLFLQMIGYTREDLEQGRLSWKDLTPPEYIHVDEQAIAELLATGNCAPFEKEFIRKDGSRVSVLIGSAMFVGEKENGSSFVMDITERRQVEEELRQSEERFRQLAESITELFWMTNPEKGEILYVSPAYEKIWGRTCESVYQNPAGWLEAIHPADRERIEKAAWTQQVSGEYDQEYRIVRPDGSVRWIRDRAFPIHDAEGNVYRVTGIAEDITDRKLAEEKIKATSAQLRALSARLQSAREQEGVRIAREIHDELGGALTTLRWDLEDINEVTPESANEPGIQVRRKKIESMMKLIDNTINKVRRISSELRPIGLDDLGLVAAIKFHARQFQDRTGIIVKCDGSLENGKLNREQSTTIFRIFQEAMTNILRHSRATRVTIQMKEENGEFHLTISDNGRGITDEEKSGQRTLGLLGMRERTHLVGGKIDISGLAGKRTVVAVRIPISG